MRAANVHFSLFEEGFWDRPDALSIVLQGPLMAADVSSVAVRCRHWRDLFPNCELILSVSETEFLIDDAHIVRLRPGAERGPSIVTSLDIIRATCSKVVLSQQDALPLPSIIGDGGPLNNINFQIRAAQAGMSIASGWFTLRVRSDLIFLSRDFIEEYSSNFDIPRGHTAFLTQRVMISSLFTLNPYAKQRSSFHFSDWFHFGLTTDIKALWDIPLMSLSDSVYYQIRSSPGDETYTERYFKPRLAIEQHISFHSANKHISFPRLLHRTDLESRELSVDILADNFIVSDLSNLCTLFPKYQAALRDPLKMESCISARAWSSIVRHRGADRYNILKNMDVAIHGHHEELIEFSVDGFFVDRGVKSYGSIVNSSHSGMLFHGPYISLRKGRYIASLSLIRRRSEGNLHVSVTAASGNIILTSMSVPMADINDNLSVEFIVDDHVIENVEIVVSMSDVDIIEVSGLSFQRCPAHDGHA